MHTMLFYKNPAVLNTETHRNLRIQRMRQPSFGFAAETNSVFLAGIELPLAAMHYPIVFSHLPNGKFVLMALLGQIEYENQELKPAQVAQRLEQLRRELPIESEFERISQAYFDLRFEDALERPAGFDIRGALLEARREVGADFAYWPNYKIVVLIYNPENFRALRAKRPEWVAGEYDGKMRVRLPEGQQDVDAVKEILYHEYTHALVHDLTNGRCGRWFDEGLATYEGKRYGPKDLDQLRSAAAQDRLISWDQLDQQFSFDLPGEAVALAYQQSYSLVRYLVERYGFWRIRRVLKAVTADHPTLETLKAELHVSQSSLERGWREWLGDRLR